MPVQVIIKRRACPRCLGDLAFEQDHYGEYWSCQACGHHVYPSYGKKENDLWHSIA